MGRFPSRSHPRDDGGSRLCFHPNQAQATLNRIASPWQRAVRSRCAGCWHGKEQQSLLCLKLPRHAVGLTVSTAGMKEKSIANCVFKGDPPSAFNQGSGLGRTQVFSLAPETGKWWSSRGQREAFLGMPAEMESFGYKSGQSNKDLHSGQPRRV